MAYITTETIKVYSEPHGKGKYLHSIPAGYGPLQRTGISSDGLFIRIGNYGAVGYGPLRQMRWIPGLQVPPVIKTRRELYVEYLHAAFFDNPDRLHDYIWGAAGHNADHSHDGDPEWDCSGLHHAAIVHAGIADDRTNAEGYRQRGTKLGSGLAASKLRAGDYAVLLRSDGTAHHIINYTGDGYCIEARGAAFGIERHNVASVNARGAVWYRDNKLDKQLAKAA